MTSLIATYSHASFYLVNSPSYNKDAEARVSYSDCSWWMKLSLPVIIIQGINAHYFSVLPFQVFYVFIMIFLYKLWWIYQITVLHMKLGGGKEVGRIWEKLGEGKECNGNIWKSFKIHFQGFIVVIIKCNFVRGIWKKQ